MIHAGIDGQRKKLLPLQRFTAFLKKSSEMNTKQSIFSSIPTKLKYNMLKDMRYTQYLRSKITSTKLFMHSRQKHA